MRKKSPKKTIPRKNKAKSSTVKGGSRQLRHERFKAAIKRRPAFRNESLAPKVDQALIKALVRRELSAADARAVYRLVYSFKSWSEAHIDAVVRDFRRAKIVSV
jgi:hypothetical protein